MSSVRAGAAEVAPPRTRPRPVLVGLGLSLLAVVVRLPTLFSPRHVGFDDGVYGATVLAMRDGAEPFRDVFSPQGPLHLVILYAGDLLGLRTLNAPRVAPVLAGVVVTLAVWAAGRRLGTAYGAALAAALVATTGTMLWTTGPITGDGIAVAFAATAAYAALAYRDRPSPWWAVATGLAIGAALLVKVLVIPVVLPVGWWLWSHRRVRDLALAVGTSVALGVVATVPWGFGNVYDQSVKYHQASRALYGPVDQAWKLLTTLLSRDLPLLVAVTLGVVAAVAAHGRRIDSDTVAVLVWLGAGTVFLIVEPAMFRNHIASLIPPLGLFVAMRPPPWRWALVAAIFVVPWWAVHLDDVLILRDYRGDEAALVEQLRALPDGAVVITDEPGFAYRTGHHLPPLLNDASIKRIEEGMITTEVVAQAAARSDVCAVAIWSNRYGRELPGLDDALTEAGFEEAESYGGVRSLWLKPDCDA
jgi:4-amino-4-deoxy-L-arabinose transferase-like glycosyltransferase